VRAVFGELYPDPVRVVSIGASIDDLRADPDDARWRDHSIEFCGGTHLTRTAAAGRFAIVQEGALAAGIRRITALTGARAEAAWGHAAALEAQISSATHLDDHALPAAVENAAWMLENETIPLTARRALADDLEALRERVKSVRKQQRASSQAGVMDQARAIADAAGGPAIVDRVAGGDKDALLAALDHVRSRHAEAATMLLSVDEEEGRVVIVARVPEALIRQGLKAGDWVKVAAKACGGGGGGRPDMAQAGGKDPARVDDAMNEARAFAAEKLA
jgi:alanyl-tRNA synthetase